MEDKRLYEIYTTKIYAVIPKNSVLIDRSKFNGKNVKVKGEGFALLSPFHESKLVSLAIRNFDYPKQMFEDINGQDVIVDLAVTVKVIDAIKFEYVNTSVEAELKQLLESIMRSLIKKHTYEDLTTNRFELPEYNERFTPSSIPNPSNIDEELINARVRLDDFAARNGLAIVNLYNKSIQQTVAVQEAYNKKVIAEREAQALKIQKEAELERAKIDAEIVKTKADAEAKLVAMRYRALKNTIKDLPLEKQAEILKIFSLDSNGKTNVFMSVDGNDSIRTGMATGAAINTVNQNNQSEERGKTK